MRIHTGLRKAMVAAAATAAVVGLSLQGTSTASAHPKCKPVSEAPPSSDMSPSTQKAWTDFICGGGRVTGGAARMVSGAWIGAVPTIISGATGEPLTADQKKAWRNWDMGAHNAGHGAGMVISGVYVGAPGAIVDKVSAGATPADLTPAQLEKVVFAMPADSDFAKAYDVPATPETPELPELPLDPIELLMELLGGAGV